MRAAAALAVAVVAPACAWDDGDPMGELTVSFAAAWTLVPDRGGEWQRLASDYEVRVTHAELGVLVVLYDTGEAALGFDPANPPAGYTLCHNGHCHTTDGRLVSYDEIAAELSGVDPAPVFSRAALVPDLLAGGDVALDCDGAPCALGLARIGRVSLAVGRLALEGEVRDTREPPRIAGEQAWSATLPLGEVTLDRPLDVPVDRGHAPAIALDVAFTPTAALLDEVAFDATPVDVATPLAAALLEAPFDVTVTRTD